MSSIVFNEDCIEGMARYPDKYFDLAVVDPPYGIENAFSASSRIRKYGQMKTVNEEKPQLGYFEELFRVSKNQIVWGYNHLSNILPTTKEFIFWYKHQPVASYSDGELAWTSFKKTAKCFDYPFLAESGQTKMAESTQLKSRLHCTPGFSRTTPNRETKSLTHILEAAAAGLLHMNKALIL